MKKTIKKSVSFLLAFVMVVGVFATMPFTAFSAGVDYNHNASTSTDEYYNLISKTDWDNAPGVTESEIVLNNDAGDYRQVVHIMKADVNNSYVNVIPTYSEMNTSKYQTGTMLDQANWIDQNMEGEVVGTMNCCLSWYTGYSAERVGEPLGFMMMNGEIMFDPGNCGYTYGNVGFPTCVVINKDVNDAGEARPADVPKLEMVQIRSSADLDGWEDTVIPISSGYIVKDGVNTSTASHKSQGEPRSVVGITADSQVVIMEVDGRQSPFSAGMNMYECAEVMIAAGCVWAANCDGGGSSTFVSQRPGEELKVNNSPSDGALRPSTSGICFVSTAPADGQFYKAHISTENEYYTPNSTVQFNAIGTDMGGTEVDIPADAYWQLADSSYGTISDGLFVSNGKEGKVAVQLVYNGEVVGEASVTIVLPDIAFKNETIVIGYGDTMVLPIEVTTNEGRNTVAYSAGDIVYTLSDENLGTIVGDKFTACDESAGLTNGTITAVVCGQTDKAVSAAIRFGKASEIIYDYEDGQLLVDTDPEVDPAEGEPYGWFIRDTRANGYFAYRFFAKKNYTPIGMDIPAQVYLVDRNNGMVRNGNYAMGIDIDWTNVTASCHGQVDVFLPESLDLTDATSVGFWMYIPAELVTASMQMRAGFLKEDGSSVVVTANITDMMGTNSGVENGGWFYFSWEVLDGYKTFEYFQINSHYTAGAGNYNYYQDVTYYIDDITVDYSDATIDRENPYFTSMTIADEYTNGVEISGQTITTNTITLMAQAYENTTKTNATGLNRNSVKLYVDGVLSNAVISTSIGGTITVSDLYLNDGVHTLVMEISDNQGNVGNIVRKVVVNTEKSTVRLEVPASDVLLPTGSIYWLNLVADNLEAIDSVTTTINLDYVNDWELEGMEVAYGFKAEYYINNHNDAVITFTRTGTEVAETTVLAKLPVRIWMAKGWMDDSGVRANYISDDPKMQDKYYILTPHAMWYSDGTRDYRLVVSAEAGVVTYVDGTTTTFSANETVIQTEMNRYYTNADRQNKWSFHICTPGTAQSKAPTCTENGYENRVFCVACACGSADNLGTECDNHNGCGSVIDWGTTIPALGHEFKIIGDSIACECGNVSNVTGLQNIEGKNYYAINGKLSSGWMGVGDEWYYFDKTTFAGVDGEQYTDDAIKFTFDNGRVTSGVWVRNGNGLRYWYGPGYYRDTSYDGLSCRPYEIDGKTYLFNRSGYMQTGVVHQYVGDHLVYYYDCGTDGVATLFTGPYNNKFYIDGIQALAYQLVQDKNGDYYFISDGNKIAKDEKLYLSEKFVSGKTFADGRNIEAGYYNFDSEGKMVIPEIKNGVIDDCIYINDVKQLAYQLVEYDGNLYFINDGAHRIAKNKKLYLNSTYVDGKTFPDGRAIQPGNYYFDAEGKMVIPEIKNGVIDDCIYINDVKQLAYQLVEYDGNLYFINDGAHRIAKNKKLYLSSKYVDGKTFPDGRVIQPDYYYFDSEGKMIIPEIKNGVTGDYLYINDVKQLAYQLVEYNGDYYFVNDGHKLAKDKTLYLSEKFVSGKTFADGRDVKVGYYYFDAEGKMVIPEIKNGVIDDCIYINDVKQLAYQLVEYDGNLYFINDGAHRIAKNKKLYLSSKYVEGKTFPDGRAIQPGYYYFDAEGKMVIAEIKNGVIDDYLYINDVKQLAYQLVEYNGDYYFVNDGHKIAKNKTLYLSEKFVKDKTFADGSLVAPGYYSFDAEGKMILN